MSLTVGDATSPAPSDEPQDTPFIPIDNGYDSDTQSVPNNQLPVPDSTDPELVSASVNLTVPGGMTATWSLSFPSAVRVFEVQNDGSFTQITAGQQFTYDPTGATGSPATSFQFQLQGVSAASPAAITAMMTPAGAPQPPNATVNANVGPSPLQVLSVNNNSAGPALTTAQQQKSGTIYLPITDAADGLVYKLPLVIHNLTVSAELLGVPAGMTILDSNGNALQASPAPAAPPRLPNNPPAVTGIFLSPSPGNDIDLYVESTEKTAPVTLTLAQVNKNHQLGTNTANGLQMFPTLGKAVITPFLLSHVQGSNTSAGPIDVPQFGTYEYKVTDVPGGQWLATDSGINPQPIKNNASDVDIPWGGGPSVDQAIYQADPQYIWDMPVNIFKITVSAGPSGAASGGTTVVQIPQDKKGSAAGLITVTTVSTFNMDASVTVQGPNGTAGMQHLNIGFVQNLAPVVTKAQYQNGPKLQGFELGSTLLNGGTIDMGNPPTAAFWDTQNTSTTTFYSDEATAKTTGSQLLKQQTNEITTLNSSSEYRKCIT